MGQPATLMDMSKHSLPVLAGGLLPAESLPRSSTPCMPHICPSSDYDLEGKAVRIPWRQWASNFGVQEVE